MVNQSWNSGKSELGGSFLWEISGNPSRVCARGDRVTATSTPIVEACFSVYMAGRYDSLPYTCLILNFGNQPLPFPEHLLPKNLLKRLEGKVNILEVSSHWPSWSEIAQERKFPPKTLSLSFNNSDKRYGGELFL